MLSIVKVWFILKPKLNYQDLSDWVQFVMKTRQYNDLINLRGTIYAENETELLWPIEPNAVCDENQHDNDLTNHISAVYIENYTELSRPIRLGTIYTKMRKNNDVTNLIKAVYVEKEFELSWSIRLGMVCDVNQTGQQPNQSHDFGLCRKLYQTFETYRRYEMKNR